MKTTLDIKGCNASTPSEALDQVGLNWIAEPVNMITENGIGIPNHKAIYRSDTKDILGVVGTNYQIIQNNIAFATFDTLCKDYNMNFNNSYLINHGATVIVEGTLNGKITIRKGDEVLRKIRISNSFDGTSGFSVDFYSYRLICSNGLMGVARDRKASIRHTLNAEARIMQAMTILARSTQYFESFEHNCQILAQKMMDTKMVNAFLDGMFSEKETTRTDNIKEAVESRFKYGQGNGQGTAWDLYNGVTEYVDHFKGKDTHKRIISSQFGTGTKIKEKAFSMLLSTAAK